MIAASKSSFMSPPGLRNAQAVSALLLAGFASGALAAPHQAPIAPSKPALVPSASAASPLEQDARLKRLVTIRAVNITLEDLLHQLSTNGLLLSADRAAGSQKLQLRLNRRPLSALMQSLAQLLPGDWQPRADGSGYIFAMSAKAVARRDRWWELFLKEQEPAKAAQRKFILAQMQTHPVLHKIYYGSTDRENEARDLEVHDLSQQDFFRKLPPDLQVRIAEQMSAHPFDRFDSGREVDEGAVVVPLTSLPEQAQKILKDEVEGFFENPRTDPAKVLVRIKNYGREVHLTLAVLKGIGVQPGIGETLVSFGVDLCPDACAMTLNHQQLVKRVKKLGDKAPPAWKELAAYQESRVWPDDAPHAPPFGGIWPQNRYRADVLNWLADHAGIDFVSDYYDSQGGSPANDAEKDQPLPRDLKEELNILARDHDTSWRRTSAGIYLFRNNRWYRDDRLEIPSVLLQHWLTQMQALRTAPAPLPKGSLPPTEDPAHFKACLDWETDVITSLTEWQILKGLLTATVGRTAAANPASGYVVPATHSASETIIVVVTTPIIGITEPLQASSPFVAAISAKQTPRVVFPFMGVAELVQNELGALRFYAGLNADQREALLAGRLPLTDLSPAQQQQFRYLAPTQSYLAGNQPIRLGAQPQVQGYMLFSGGASLPFTWVNLYLTAVPASRETGNRP